MINLNFKNAFPKPSKEFDQKIERTLQKIVQEEERNNMKKHHLFSKKILIVAAAAILVIGTGVFASGKITSYVSQSSSIPTDTSIPSNAELQSKYGFVPTIVDKFSNGYQFNGMTTVNSKGLDEDGNTVKASKDIDIKYKNGKDKIWLNVVMGSEDETGMNTVDTYQGTDIKYSFYDSKVVPPDYKMTAQDKEDEKSGKYVFSYGSDKVEVNKVQSLSWQKGGVSYMFTLIDSPLTKDDLVKMAHEAISAK